MMAGVHIKTEKLVSFGIICCRLTQKDTETHTCFILASSLRVCSSFLRSFLLPTRMIGTFGQKCFTSGVHFSGMFSRRIKNIQIKFKKIKKTVTAQHFPDFSLQGELGDPRLFPCDCTDINTERSLTPG